MSDTTSTDEHAGAVRLNADGERAWHCNCGHVAETDDDLDAHWEAVVEEGPS